MNAPNLTLSGDLSVAGVGKTVAARTIQAPPANNLQLAGIANVGIYLNAPSATVANSLIVNGVDVGPTLSAKAGQATTYAKTEIDEQRDIQNLKAPKASPTFTGTTNAADVTLSGNLSVAGTSKTITARTIQAPPASNLELAGIVNVGTYLNAPDATISNGLTVNGSLSVTSFFPVKPYFAAYVLSEAISYQFGHVAATLTRLNGTGGVFQFNLPTAHPRGVNYLVIAQVRAGATAGQTFPFCSTNVTSRTAFNVWVRNSTMGSINGDFYVYTVP